MPQSLSDRRRERVRQLIRERFDGKQSDFARAIGREPNYVSRMLSSGPHRKRIAEDLAREIEAQLRLPHLWLDTPATTMPVSRDFDPTVTEPGLKVAREWEKLREPVRTEIQRLIEMLAQNNSGKLP